MQRKRFVKLRRRMIGYSLLILYFALPLSSTRIRRSDEYDYAAADAYDFASNSATLVIDGIESTSKKPFSTDDYESIQDFSDINDIETIDEKSTFTDDYEPYGDMLDNTDFKIIDDDFILNDDYEFLEDLLDFDHIEVSNENPIYGEERNSGIPRNQNAPLTNDTNKKYNAASMDTHKFVPNESYKDANKDPYNYADSEMDAKTIISNEESSTPSDNEELHEFNMHDHIVRVILLSIILFFTIPAIYFTNRKNNSESSFDDGDGLKIDPSNGSRQNTADKSWSKEAWNLISLSIPLVALEVDGILPHFFAASYIGRYLGPVHLSGFTLAMVLLNIIVFSLLWGFYSANETLSPQAFGAGNYKELGLIAMRSYILSLCILFFVNTTLYFFIEDFLLLCGQEKEPSKLAAQWFRISMIGLPFYALYSVTLRFLSAQKIVKPQINVMIVATCIVLPLCLELLVPILGFVGAAIALIIQQVLQAVLLLCYIAFYQPHYKETWPGISAWRQSLDSEALTHYIHLGIGGILAYGDWIWIKIIALFIGTLGVTSLGAHGIASQFLNLSYMFPFGTGSALSIYLGSTLPQNAARARTMAFWSALIMVLLLTFLSIGVFVGRKYIFAIFTKDPEVMHATDEIWINVDLAQFSFGITGIFTAIAIALGMQWLLSIVQIIFLWFIALPGIYIQLTSYNGDLNDVWGWFCPTYMVMNLILAYRFASADWDEISRKVCFREEASTINKNDIPDKQIQ